MSRFVFKLQSVLEQRVNAERQRQRDFADAQRRTVRIERELETIKEALHGGTALRRGLIDPRVLLAQARYQSALQQKLASLRSQMETARKAMGIAQAALVEAAKQRKIMEKLRENQQRRYETDQQRRDARDYDDLSRRLHRAQSEIESPAGLDS